MKLPQLPLFLSIAGLLLGSAGCSREPAEADETATATHVPVVTVVKVRQQKLRQTTTQPATIQAYQDAEIYAKVSGYLKKLDVDIGEQVTPTSVLAVISVPETQRALESQQADVKRLQAVERRRAAEHGLAIASEKSTKALAAQAKAKVRSAVAQLAADRAERERIAGLVADNSVARRLLDEMEQKYQAAAAGKSAAEAAQVAAESEIDVAAKKVLVAKALWDSAKEDTEVARKKREEIAEMINYATLKAPFVGIVTDRNVDVGDLVRNTQTASGSSRKPLFVISDVSKVRVRVAVPENDAPFVKDNAEVVLTLRSLPGRKFRGRVTRSSHKLDERTRTMLVEMELKNPQRELLPGMFGEATITLKQKPNALVLPADAVRHDSAGKATVCVVDKNDTIRIVGVQTGVDLGDWIEITSGVSAGDRVAGATVGRLKSGQKVRVKTE
jgi:HlyD family secretion protein